MPDRTTSATANTTSETTRSPRGAASARSQLLRELKDDHKRVKKAYTEFRRLDREADPERCEEIVQQVLTELTTHMALEEELLYPAAREALGEADLIDEAEVEHESAHTLIERLRQMSPDDDKYAASFTVLCEYVMHHVEEEEGEMFPALQKADIAWVELADEMRERRSELEMGGQSDDEDAPKSGRTGTRQPASPLAR